MSFHGRLALLLLMVVVLIGACGEGLRPTLVEVGSGEEPAEPLRLDLEPAPEGVLAIAPTQDGFPLASSVDDALAAWAADRQIPYLDSCAIAVPTEGQYCDSPTDLDTVRLLGPSADEPWYVVTVLEAFTPDEGRGYRVSSVEIAGR